MRLTRKRPAEQKVPWGPNQTPIASLHTSLDPRRGCAGFLLHNLLPSASEKGPLRLDSGSATCQRPEIRAEAGRAVLLLGGSATIKWIRDLPVLEFSGAAGLFVAHPSHPPNRDDWHPPPCAARVARSRLHGGPKFGGFPFLFAVANHATFFCRAIIPSCGRKWLYLGTSRQERLPRSDPNGASWREESATLVLGCLA